MERVREKKGKVFQVNFSPISLDTIDSCLVLPIIPSHGFMNEVGNRWQQQCSMFVLFAGEIRHYDTQHREQQFSDQLTTGTIRLQQERFITKKS